MKVLSTAGLTKLIELIKSSFISVDDTETTTEIDTETTSEVTLATVATSGSYNDLTDKPVSRNIGEIIQSTIPLSDAGLHLLDGALISGSGSYADFVTYIAGLVSGYPDLFETEANWQTSVTNYGVCGKFVYDSVNNTVRLPKITGFIEGTTSLTALGDLIEAGLPNITGNITLQTLYNEEVPSDGVFTTYTGSASQWTGSAQLSRTIPIINFDASRSNQIYGNSNTVQPQAIKVLYYIVLATSTKTDIEVDIDEIATDLNGKADVDLSNVSIASSFSNALNTAGIRTVVESYQNGTDWYRIYSDGWCEQGGQTSQMNETITLLKEMADTNYSVSVTCKRGTAPTNAEGNTCGYASSTTQIFTCSGASYYGSYWEVRGYISQGV